MRTLAVAQMATQRPTGLQRLRRAYRELVDATRLQAIGEEFTARRATISRLEEVAGAVEAHIDQTAEQATIPRGCARE